MDPNFISNQTIYLYYTFKKFGACPAFAESVLSEFPVNRVSRFRLPESNVVDPGSEVVLIDNIPSLGWHNGGDLHFGPNGHLYVSVGDGSCDLQDRTRCQNLNDNARDNSILLGKILRVRADGTLPSDNPYSGDPGVRRCGNPTGVPSGAGRCGEIFATGLRNPFRFAFKPGTDTFYINDVGTDIWEEVNRGQKGADYGFNVREGHCNINSRTNCGVVPGLTDPIHDYDHNTGCRAITGGAFVPDGLWPAPYSGAYLYGDYVCGKIFLLVSEPGGGFTRTTFIEGLGSSSAVHMVFGPFHGYASALLHVLPRRW